MSAALLKHFFQSLNQVLYSNDPKDLPLTDLDAASSLPYDTDIPEGGQRYYNKYILNQH